MYHLQIPNYDLLFPNGSSKICKGVKVLILQILIDVAEKPKTEDVFGITGHVTSEAAVK